MKFWLLRSVSFIHLNQEYITMVPQLILSVLLIGQAMAVTPALEAIAETNSKFSRDFFKSIASTPGNLVSSPLSAHLALAMLQLGAGGNTASVMSTAMHLPANKTISNEGFKQLTSTLHNENSNGISLKIANRVYLQNNFPVKEDFIKSVTETFDSNPQNVDFVDPNTRVAINRWVEDVTQNKIKDLIEDGVLDGDTRAVLVNAVYFFGKWANRFDPGSTYSSNFYTSETDTVRVPFMSEEASYKYAVLNDLNSKIVAIPYEGNKMSLVILLPNSRTGLSDLEKKMETQDLSALINSAGSTTINLVMPKFKIETTIDLKEPLQKMGMGEIFENTADFSNIASQRLKISKALQKTIIQVAENGTEAVSATYFTAVPLSANLNPPPWVVIDHPFLFYLVHRTSNTHHVVLFSGRVVEPQGYPNIF